MSVNAFGQASNIAKTNTANVDTSAFLRVDGTKAMQGLLDMGGNKIANVQTPSEVETFAREVMLIRNYHPRVAR